MFALLVGSVIVPTGSAGGRVVLVRTGGTPAVVGGSVGGLDEVVRGVVVGLLGVTGPELVTATAENVGPGEGCPRVATRPITTATTAAMAPTAPQKMAQRDRRRSPASSLTESMVRSVWMVAQSRISRSV
jgi:hypothetical protein